MPKATWKKDAKKCAKKSFGLEIWCSWLRFRRPGARPGRPKSVPRAAQDGPKIWARLVPALLGALGHFFAFFCDFVWILVNVSSIFATKKFWELGFLAGAACCLLLLSWSLSSKSVPAFAGFCLLVPAFARSRVELILNLNSSWLYCLPLLTFACFWLPLLALACFEFDRLHPTSCAIAFAFEKEKKQYSS